MSSEIFLKAQMRALLASSKKDTGKKFITFNDNITDMFNQVDVALAGLRNRLSALESSSVTGSTMPAEYFVLDSSGDLCQRDNGIKKPLYIINGSFYEDEDGDICQNLEIADENDLIISENFYIDSDDDLCQEDTDNNEQQIS